MSETATGTASLWPPAGGVGPAAGPSTVQVPAGGGAITVTGFGDKKTVTKWSGPGSSYRSAEEAYGDAQGYSASDLNSIFDKMVYNNDPRINALMKQTGATSVSELRKLWSKAATRAGSIAKAGQAVDFFQVLTSQILESGQQDGAPSAPTVQPYVTNYFDAKGRPNAAAKALLKEQLTEAFGRVPSADEIKEYSSLFADMAAKQQAGLFTTRVNNRTGVTTPGVDPKDWLAEQIANRRQARVQYGKEEATQSFEDKYTSLAKEYGFNPYNPDGSLSEAARLTLSRLEANKMTIDDVQEQLKQAALAKYPHLKPQLDAGLSVMQTAAPALKSIANILERDVSAMDVDDPLVQKYLYGVDGKGTMPLYKYESLLKQDNSWQFTKNARDQFSDLAAFIGSKFGINV